jgi:hypothetical protein
MTCHQGGCARSAALAGMKVGLPFRETREIKHVAGAKNVAAVDDHVGSRVRMRRIWLGMSQESSVTFLGWGAARIIETPG